MPLARNDNFNHANRILTIINLQAEQSASCNLQSDLVHLEDTFLELLNCVYGWHLINANTVKDNYPGIDLIDRSAKVCVQGTADTSPKKVASTLKNKEMASLAEQGYTLYFCYIGAQHEKVRKRTPRNPHGVSYNPKSNSILTKDILKAFNSLTIERQEEALCILRREVREGATLTADSMRDKLNSAISQLGPRYSPDINVQTPDMKRLFALTDEGEFRNELEESARLAEESIQRLQLHPKSNQDYNLSRDDLECFSCLLDKTSNRPNTPCGADSVCAWALDLNNAAHNCSSKFSSSNVSYSGTHKPLADALHRVRNIQNACEAYGVEYLDGKRILICGEAGVGKSHLLGDLCNRVLDRGGAALLLLGNQFDGRETPAESIPKILGFNGSFDDLLAELQRYAGARNTIAVLAIDALNEGEGRVIWKTRLHPLLEKIDRYPSVRLLLSVRNTYRNDVIPEDLLDGQLKTMECKGFASVSFKAIKTLCDHYNLAYPTTPLVGAEYSNPLYLKLLCSYLNNQNKPFTTNIDMEDLVGMLLSNINSRLADAQRCDYDRRVPLARRAAKAIMVSDSYSYGSMEYTKASKLVAGAVRDYVAIPGNYLRNLVSEGLFNVFESPDRSSRIEFSYELIGNYVATDTVIERAKELHRSSDVGSEAEALSALLSNQYQWMAADPGVLMALSVMCPSEHICEIFDLALDDPLSVVANAFVKGLPWRTMGPIDSNVDNYIHDVVLSNETSMHNLFNTSFQLATKSGGVNAEYFKKLLLSIPLSLRDYTWSSTIATSSKADCFADWTWEHGRCVNDQDVRGIATMLALCLPATNVSLRRKAIKSLVLIMINRHELAEHIWEDFSTVEDDYILEGPCGAIYGSAVNSSDPIVWVNIAENVYSFVFKDGHAYPNVIVRDYATLLNDAFLHTPGKDIRQDKPFFLLMEKRLVPIPPEQRRD